MTRGRKPSGRRRSIALALGIAGLATLSGAPAAAPRSDAIPATAPLEPASGALFGAWHKNLPADIWTTTEFARFESLVGRRLDIDHRYHAWGSTYWPGAPDRWDVTGGRIPMASLGGSKFPGLDAVLNGSQDTYLTGLADRIRGFGSRMFLRPLWEMNGDWMPWGGPNNNSPGLTDGPAKYVRAWRRMHDIFMQRGATNAVWVWSPNCADWPKYSYNRFANYYPGDAYVDWAGCDEYNWGTARAGKGWQSWAGLFGGTASVYSTYPHKPFMVAETGSCEQGGDKAGWLRDMHRDVKASFPNVKAVVYFDEFHEQSINCDWRVTTSAGALDAYRAMGADPYFRGASPAPPPAPSPTPAPTPIPGDDPVITAAGDYTTSSTRSNAVAVKNTVVAANPDLHLGIGDFQYSYISSIYSGFDQLWGPKPGGLWAKIRPTAGPTHDVNSCTDLNYQNYWGRPAMKGYSFDLGSWHIISLPSAAVRYGCDVAGVTAWLKADLAAHASRSCTLAFWQDAYWTRPTSTHRRENGVKPWAQALYDAGAEVVLQASNHDYQRFAPQNMSDQRDDLRGIRAFVVGTGGIGLYPFTGTAPNVEASSDTTYGALKMVLHPDGYDFQFLRAAGGTFADAGSGSCH